MQAQTNLIPNPGFEEHGPFENSYDYDISNVSHWNGHTQYSIYYYHTLNTSPTSVHGLPNIMVDILPHSGEAITGIAVGAPDATNPSFIQARQYLGIALTEPLVPGYPYRLSFWLANGDVVGRLGLFMPGKGCNRFGALLGTAPPPLMPKDPFTHPFMANAKPQLEIDAGIFYHEEWRQYAFEFTPDSAYSYITFGNFYPDSLLSCAKFDSALYVSSFGLEYWYVDRAYYFIDDVVLEPRFHILTNDTLLCPGDGLTLAATGAYQGGYQWFTDADPSVFSTDSAVAVSPLQSTRYVASDGFYSDTVFVEVRPVPQPDLGGEAYLCPGGSLLLQPETSGAGAYLWSDGGTESTLTITQAGDYWLQLGDSLCGFAADTVSVALRPMPQLPDWETERQRCPGDSLRLEAAPSGAGGGYTYLWSSGEAEPGIGVGRAGRYGLTVTDQCGQSAVFETNVSGEGCPHCHWQVPTAFSPDGNGLNDTFRPHVSDCNRQGYRLCVYSRWGERLFEAADPAQAWEGTNQKGRGCQTGVYVWTMEITNTFGQAEMHRGWVMLLR